MHLRSDSFRPYAYLDPRLALGRVDPASRATFSRNRNPHLAWSDPPPGTASFALLGFDSEVPSRGDDVNQEGRSVPLDLPRVDFFHWVLIDLPANLRHIEEGAHSDGLTPRGKAPGRSPSGGLQGLNDYTGWFAGSDLAGQWAGYDGPFPPWNDSRVHAYHFVLYALDVPTLGLSGAFDGRAVRERLRGHVLAEVRLTGLYSLNPAVRDGVVAQVTAWARS